MHPCRNEKWGCGDVVGIAAGTGNWFTGIEDHVEHIMCGSLTQARNGEPSPEYLSKPARRGDGEREARVSAR